MDKVRDALLDVYRLLSDIEAISTPEADQELYLFVHLIFKLRRDLDAKLKELAPSP